MRHFDHSVVQPYVAFTVDEIEPSNPSANVELRTIPRLCIRPTYFGPSVRGGSQSDRAAALLAGPKMFDSLLTLAAYMRRERIQIVHCTEKPRDAFYGVLLARLAGAKSVVHLHVGFDDWLSPQAKWAIRRADGLIGVSRFITDNMLRGGLPPERTYTVLNSLDLTRSRWNDAIDGEPTRAALGIAPGVPVVGIASRLFVWKGQTFLMHAMRRVIDTVPEARLVIVGEDDPRAHPGGGSYRAELEALADELGMRDRVIFTGFRRDIPELMAAFDVFAMPSWEEPFGMVFLEAATMRTPVVAWAHAGALEAVADGETGLLVERGNVEALAEALLRLVRAPELRHRMGEAGRRRVEQQFGPVQMCADTIAVYRAVLGEAPAPTRIQAHLHGG